MKQYLPYNVLLAAAVVMTGLMIFYNVAMRDSFAVTVAYTIPGIPRPKPQNVITITDDEGEAGEYFEEYDDYDYNKYNEEHTLTSVTFPLDLNRATEQELRFIPQVGNVMAQRIVQYRDFIGGYASLEQLKEIQGVGDATYDKISAYLILEGDGQDLSGDETVSEDSSDDNNDNDE